MVHKSHHQKDKLMYIKLHIWLKYFSLPCLEGMKATPKIGNSLLKYEKMKRCTFPVLPFERKCLDAGDHSGRYQVREDYCICSPNASNKSQLQN